MSDLKISRARKLSKIGDCHGTFAAMASHVSVTVADAVSSRTLATIIDDLYDASQAAKAIAVTDAIAEGAVWDARQERHRNIAA